MKLLPWGEIKNKQQFKNIWAFWELGRSIIPCLLNFFCQNRPPTSYSTFRYDTFPPVSFLANVLSVIEPEPELVLFLEIRNQTHTQKTNKLNENMKDIFLDTAQKKTIIMSIGNKNNEKSIFVGEGESTQIFILASVSGLLFTWFFFLFCCFESTLLLFKWSGERGKGGRANDSAKKLKLLCGTKKEVEAEVEIKTHRH